jgi:hypothetical protein
VNAKTLINKLVSYTSIVSGTVKGKIVGEGTDRFGDFYRVKVTTADVPAYKKGSEFIVSAENFGKVLVLR